MHLLQASAIAAAAAGTAAAVVPGSGRRRLSLAFMRRLRLVLVALLISASTAADRASYEKSRGRCSAGESAGLIVKLWQHSHRRLTKDETDAAQTSISAWTERLLIRFRDSVPIFKPPSRMLNSAVHTPSSAVQVEVLSEALAILKASTGDVTSAEHELLVSSILADNETKRVEANCIITVGNEPGPEPPKGYGHARSLSHNAEQVGAAWNLDRIDSRDGIDSVFSAGPHGGEDVDVYILDTGIRTSHSEFGGRVRPGWSPGCPTGSETSCGSDWTFGGVADASCSDHGTHCASIAVGSSVGVARHASIISVQAISCSGEGSIYTIMQGIDWAVRQAVASGRRSIVSMSICCVDIVV